MRAQHAALERLPIATIPLTDAINHTTERFGELLQAYRPIVQRIPPFRAGNTNREAASIGVDLPVCPALFASPQFDICALINRHKSVIE